MDAYLPHQEWDNDAETTIAPLFIHPVDDEEVDMALKLAQVRVLTCVCVLFFFMQEGEAGQGQ